MYECTNLRIATETRPTRNRNRTAEDRRSGRLLGYFLLGDVEIWFVGFKQYDTAWKKEVSLEGQEEDIRGREANEPTILVL
jgi:hypothetical protein